MGVKIYILDLTERTVVDLKGNMRISCLDGICITDKTRSFIIELGKLSRITCNRNSNKIQYMAEPVYHDLTIVKTFNRFDFTFQNKNITIYSSYIFELTEYEFIFSYVHFGKIINGNIQNLIVDNFSLGKKFLKTEVQKTTRTN